MQTTTTTTTTTTAGYNTSDRANRISIYCKSHEQFTPCGYWIMPPTLPPVDSPSPSPSLKTIFQLQCIVPTPTRVQCI